MDYDNDYVLNGTQCICYYDVGHWNWTIPDDPGYISIADEYVDMIDNITWDWSNTTLSADDFDSSRRRRLVDTSCYTVLVTSCVSDSCSSSDKPVDSNYSYSLEVIGETFENWTDYTLSGDSTEESYCYCYWMYAVCGTLSPTVEPTNSPTYQPTDPSNAPTAEPTEYGLDVVAIQAETWLNENLTMIIVVIISIFLFYVVCCFLCIRKRRKFYAVCTRRESVLYGDYLTLLKV